MLRVLGDGGVSRVRVGREDPNAIVMSKDPALPLRDDYLTAKAGARVRERDGTVTTTSLGRTSTVARQRQI